MLNSCRFDALIALSVLISVSTSKGAEFNIADGDVAGLIAAINTANSTAEADTINLAANGVYTLTAPAQGTNGLPTIGGHDLTFNGNHARIQRSAAANTPAFRIASVVAGINGRPTAVFNDITFSNGLTNSSGDGAGLHVGGAIAVLNRCSFENNHAAHSGGGVYGGSGTFGGCQLTITDCRFAGNQAQYGGGLTIDHGGSGCRVTGSTFTTNAALPSAGVGGWGGAVYIDSTTSVLVQNCTLSGNQAANGGGAYNFRGNGLTIAACTIAYNSASPAPGGGVYTENSFGGSTWFGHTIVANNTAPSNPDIAASLGGVYSNDYNLIGVPGSIPIACSAPCHDLLNVDPKLQALADNGGPTLTHALACDSPALNAGSPTNWPTTTDQRGQPRVGLGNPVSDIGAFERQPGTPDADQDGIADVCDTCPSTPANALVDPRGCPLPIGACCLPSGPCREIPELTCTWLGGTWQGSGSSCASAGCAVLSGSVAAWGRNTSGQLNVSAPNQNFVAVSAGFDHSLGLRSDGTVAAWGRSNEGQLAVPGPNANFVAVAAGFRSSLGLKADGSIVGWGDNTYGQSTPPVPNTGFVAIAAGGGHSAGLRANGRVEAWGNDSNGEVSGVLNQFAPFKAVAAAGHYSLALTTDGKIVAWGDGSFGILVLPDPNIGFKAIAAGGESAVALRPDGTVATWGNGATLPAENSGFTAIDGGGSFILGLKSNSNIVGWGGQNQFGELNIATPNFWFSSRKVGDVKA